MKEFRNIAVVAPLDFTSFLCNKYLIKYLLDDNTTGVVYVLGQRTPNTDYVKVIESWGAIWIDIATPRHVSIIRDIRYYRKLKGIFKSLKINCVINLTTKPNVYGPLAARAAGVDFVFTGVWGRGTAFTEDGSFKRLLIRFVLKHLLRLSFKRSDLTWITNPEDFNYLIRKGIVHEEKAFLTKNYVDTDFFSRDSIDSQKVELFRKSLDYTGDDFVVTLVGRMIWPKGIKEFAEASEILKDKHPHIKFLLIGAEENSSPDSVPTELLNQWSKRPNFKWIGYQEDILTIYGATDLAVLPSYYKEGGYPRALTEPMSIGLPVITSDSKDCREPVIEGYNGYRVAIRDSVELSKRIVEIYKDESLRIEFGQNSRDRVLLEFSEKVIVQEVVSIFRSCWE